MKSLILCLFIAVVFTSCNNLEDASPAHRNTFTKFFEGPYNLSASSVELIPGGFIILGNEVITLADTTYVQTILIEVSEQGNKIGDIHTYGGGTGKSFKPLTGGTGAVGGYIIVGDSIYIDPQAEQAANVSIASMRILVVNSSFDPVKNVYITDKAPLTPGHPVKTDFYGGAVNLTPTGNIIVLGTFKEGVVNQQATPEKQLLFSLDNNQDSTWFKTYDLLTNTYVNAKSVHYSNGNILWATAIADVQGDFTSSYLAIPRVTESSVFENFDPFGQTTTQLFLPQDIQPANTAAFGYGVIGTYSQTTDGSKANLFFLRVDTEGNIIPGSDLYFDGIESFKPDSLDISKDNSSIIDNGEAITSTKDGGFVLAGSMTTNPSKGKGGKDILLIKVTSQGTMLWAKTLGSSGDETVSAIRELSDGGLLICGTNSLGGFSSIFLMKTDKNGELKN